MTDFAISALSRKRAELAGEIEARCAALDQLRADLAHLDAEPHAAANTRTGSGSWDGSARRRSFARTGCRWSHGAYSALAHPSHTSRGLSRPALAAPCPAAENRQPRPPATRQIHPRNTSAVIMPPTLAARSGLATLKLTIL